MTAERIAADEFFAFYRDKYRLLLYFGPVGYRETIHGPFTRTRNRDVGDVTDLDLPPWNPRGPLSFKEYDAMVDTASRSKGGVFYSEECRKRDLVGVMLVDPGIIRVPEKNDPRVSLETEMGLREHFKIMADQLSVILVGKDSREYGRYAPPVYLDDILRQVDQIDDSGHMASP